MNSRHCVNASPRIRGNISFHPAVWARSVGTTTDPPQHLPHAISRRGVDGLGRRGRQRLDQRRSRSNTGRDPPGDPRHQRRQGHPHHMPVAVLRVVERGVTADLLTVRWVSLLHIWVFCLGRADARAGLLPALSLLRGRIEARVPRGWSKAIAKRREALLRRVGGARRLHGPPLTPATESCARPAQNNAAKLQKG